MQPLLKKMLRDWPTLFGLLVIAMVNWVQVARVIYTQTKALVEKEFIEARRALGASDRRILFCHILPHIVPTMLVSATLAFATTVLLEATLSFVGAGVRPPTPSSGNIIFENQTYFATAAMASGSSSGSRPDWRTPASAQPDAMAARPCCSSKVTEMPSWASR